MNLLYILLVLYYYNCCELHILSEAIESVLGDGLLRITTYHMIWSPSLNVGFTTGTTTVLSIKLLGPVL